MIKWKNGYDKEQKSMIFKAEKIQKNQRNELVLQKE